MGAIRERVLEQRVKRGLDDRVIRRINKRLDRLKADSPWGVTYRWGKTKRRLHVQTGPLHWEAVFTARVVTIDVEGPSYLRLVLIPARRATVAVLKEEIDALSR